MHLLVAAVFANLLCLLQSWEMVATFYMETCDGDAKLDENADLSVATIHIMAVDRDTRMKHTHFISKEKVCDRKIFTKPSVKIYWNGEKQQKLLGELPSYDLVVGMLVVRKEDTCDNDNPVAFTDERYPDCKCKTKTPGSGSDFSSMYSKSPFRPGNIKIILYKDNEENEKNATTLLNYTTPADCYKTDTWIANQGVYLLDVGNEVWYPVYYDIWNDDVFLM